MIIRPGGIDGESEIDRGLLKRSGDPGSDVLMLDCEFTVAEGPHARRKFWQMFTVSGGKLDESGVSIGGKITKSTLRAMIDSALGLDPAGHERGGARPSASCAASPISPASPSSPRSRSRRATTPPTATRTGSTASCVPTEPEWRQIMNGEAVPARPSTRRQPRGDRGHVRAGVGARRSRRPRDRPRRRGRRGPPASRPRRRSPPPPAGPAWLNG